MTIRHGASERAVTLVEMMIVIAIIGFIAAVAINRYTHAAFQGQVSQAEQNIRHIAAALDQYNIDKGGYPASGNVTPTLFGGSGNQYFNATPLDGSNQYVYRLNGNDYSVCSGQSHDYGAEATLHLQDFSTASAPTSNEYVCYSPSEGVYTASTSAGL